MQTFLPLPSFEDSALVLDNKRLGNQRSECKVILKCLVQGAKGWSHHPATKMWKGYEGSLLLYAKIIALTWRRRGNDDETLEFFESLDLEPCPPPPWFGRNDFHSMHRAVLLDKDYSWYSRFGWSEQPAIKVKGSYPYVWPV